MIAIILSIYIMSFSGKSVWCPKVDQGPRIDGVTADSIWQYAVTLDDFIEVFPAQERKPQNRTICHIMCDKENLYLGFECYNRDKIVANNRVRDKFSKDEKISILFCPNNDQSTAYALFISPLNTQIDIKILNNGEKMIDWDGVWYSEVKKNANGWSCELKIPFMVFKEGFGQKYWGLEITRETYVADQQILIRWAKPVYELIRPSDFGRLYFYEEIPFWSKTAFIPYGTAQKNFFSDSTTSVKYKTGGEVNFSAFTFADFDFIINPDFSQIEADPEEIDLSKTIRRLPEKRNFFLSSYENIKTPIEIMYTRSMKEINYGGKMKLSARNTSIEGWHVTTDSTSTEPRAQISNIAFNADVLKRTTFRFLFINKYTSSSYNNDLEVTLYQPLPKDFSFSGQFALDWTEASSARAYYISFDRLVFTGIRASMYHKMIDSSFAAPLGYIPFKNMRETYGNIAWFNLLNRKIIQSIDIGCSGLHRTLLSNDLLCQNLMPFASITFIKPLYIYYTYTLERRRLGGKLYDNITNYLSFNISPERKFSITLGYYFGDYFGQYINFLSLMLGNLNIANRINLELNLQSQTLNNGEKTTTNNLANLKIAWFISKNICFRNFFKFSDLSKLLNANFMFDYNIASGSHIYFILNEERQKTGSIFNTDFRKRILLFKITYRLSF